MTCPRILDESHGFYYEPSARELGYLDPYEPSAAELLEQRRVAFRVSALMNAHHPAPAPRHPNGLGVAMLMAAVTIVGVAVIAAAIALGSAA